MSSVFRLTLKEKINVIDIYNIIKLTAEKEKLSLITDKFYEQENCKTILAVFEKYYIRNNSFTNLTILLTQNNNETILDIVGSGGGFGIFNISIGSNTDITIPIINAALELGFDMIS